MIGQRLLIVFFLIFLIDAKPIDQFIRLNGVRQRRSINLMNWISADELFKQFYLNQNLSNEPDIRMKRSETPSEFRPVQGPISIEQVPAMLAARSVKRYPYSQEFDPALIG